MSELIPRKPPDDGLQAERTSLAWSRTAFAVLANGVLLLLRDLYPFTGPLRLLPALMAVVVALVTYAVGRQRQRTLRQRPLPAVITARRHIQGIGVAILVLIFATAVALPV
ncbi:uncharacterized membrane protein YidH (DUF202 family) [Nocardia sp. GAS34]